MAGGAGTLFVSAVNDWAPRDSDRNATSMPGFPLARGSVWAGGCASGYTPSQVPPRGGATSCRETAPLTYLLHLQLPLLVLHELCYLLLPSPLRLSPLPLHVRRMPVLRRVRLVAWRCGVAARVGDRRQ